MKLTNLYNYGSSKVITISSYTTLDSDPVIWDSENVSDEFDKQFAPAIYDCAKENSPYILIIELLELHEVSLEEINEKILKIQTNCAPAIQYPHRAKTARHTKFTIKLDYLIQRIDSYWPKEIDKKLVLYRRLYEGQKLEKMTLDICVHISTLKWLFSDFRRILRLYKFHLCTSNNNSKLTPQQFAFIQQFLI